MNRKLSTLHYCGRCRITTPHEVMGDGFTCRRCGCIKHETRAKSTRRTARTTEDASGHLSQSDACSMPFAGAVDAILN